MMIFQQSQRSLGKEGSLQKCVCIPTQRNIPAEVPATSADTCRNPLQSRAPSEAVAPKPEPAEPVVAKRGRGRPPGSKNKPKACPNCTASASMRSPLHKVQVRTSMRFAHSKTTVCKMYQNSYMRSTLLDGYKKAAIGWPPSSTISALPAE